MDDNRKRSGNCKRCGEKYSSIEYHIPRCKFSIEGIDYIKCKLCKHIGLALYSHVKKHNLTVSEYEEKFGSLYSENTLKNISERNSTTQKKSNYRNRLKYENRLDELKDFNKKVGKKVSEVVLADENLRKIRSKTLSDLNKTDLFRKKASETAVKTSARKDIQEKRSLNLRKWREENPEKFLEILAKAHEYKSKPQRELFNIIESKYLNFKENQQIKHELFVLNKTKRKQIDIFCKERRIIIEFDGRFHFENIEKWNQLELVQKKDAELNSLKNEFCIIRVSYDQYSYNKTNGGFNQKCIDELMQVINENRPGLYLIGDMYAKS